MFEMPPFIPCPSCKAMDSFGILNVSSRVLTRRCKACRFSARYPLKALSKKVIYIDQLALSEMVKAEKGERSAPLDDYWRALRKQIKRVLLLQLAVFPHSPIHIDESLMSSMYDQLNDLYEEISGETSLLGEDEISNGQIHHYAESWLRGEVPADVPLSVDRILHGDRNAWLNLLQVRVNSNYESLVDDIRKSRDSVSVEMDSLFADWRKNRESFEVVLEREMAGWSREVVRQIANLPVKLAEAQASDDPMQYFNLAMGPANRLVTSLRELFTRNGIPDDLVLRKCLEFLLWDKLREAPSNKISAYFFAALSRKAASGQKRPPSKGMMNDVKVISCYAPYVDAMFIDNECAALLAEEPLRSELPIRARIFSTNTRTQFLDYLVQLELEADAEIKATAKMIYGLRD